MSGAPPDQPVSVHVDDGAGARPDVVWVDNGVLRLGFVPALGGRLLSVRLRGTETLWRNDRLLDDALHPVGEHRPEPVAGEMSDWNNYGGDKTWPAPQGWSGDGEWAGPPDPVLDSGPYAVRIEQPGASVIVELTSADDPRSGLRLRRRFTLAPRSAAYEVQLEATNVSDAPVTWALWNVMQRAGRPSGTGGVHVGMDPGPHVGTPLAEGTGFPRHSSVDATRVFVPHQDVVGKVGFADASGWLAHVSGITPGSTVSTQSFGVVPGAAYPDKGSRVEIWMEHPLPAPLDHLGGLNPPARIVEVEVLGPSVTLAPDESTGLSLRCGVGDLPVDGGTDGIGPEVTAVVPAGHWTLGPTVADGRVQRILTSYVDGELLVGDSVVSLVEAGVPTPVQAPADASGPMTLLAVREARTGRLLPAGSASLDAPVETIRDSEGAGT